MNKNVIQALMKGYKNFRKITLELLYPNTCVLCGELSYYGVCDNCKTHNPLIHEPRCMRCGKPINSEEKEYCNDCANGNKSFEQGRSLWLHSGNVKQSIYRFKYKNKRIYTKTYAYLFVREFGVWIEQWKPDCIIPIPIHSKRRRERGYNQAEILASAIREELGNSIPVMTGVIYRKRVTIHQKKLDNHQRRKNIKGAFGMRNSRGLPRKVLVIDDIYTTGATLQEVSKLLQEHGVREVRFLTISLGQGF